jgi:hypothetical protein
MDIVTICNPCQHFEQRDVEWLCLQWCSSMDLYGWWKRTVRQAAALSGLRYFRKREER